jgi:hypothetical protein
MIRVAITQAAYAAIAATLPLGRSPTWKPNEKGERFIWIEARALALLRPCESYSEVILRLVEIEAKGRR